MRACLIFFILITFISSIILSQEIALTARQRSLANTSVTLFDEGSVFSNPSGLAKINETILSITYWGIFTGLDDNSDIKNTGIIFTKKLKKGTLGIGYFSTGLDLLYCRILTSISYGFKLSETLLLGTGLDFTKYQYFLNEWTFNNPYFNNNKYQKTATSFNLSLSFISSKYFTLGLDVKNINTPDTGINEKYTLPLNYTAGLKYSNLDLNILFEYGMYDYKNSNSLAVEKFISGDNFALRAGINFDNNSNILLNSGFGVKTKNIKIDYAFSFNFKGISECISNFVTLSFLY